MRGMHSNSSAAKFKFNIVYPAFIGVDLDAVSCNNGTLFIGKISVIQTRSDIRTGLGITVDTSGHTAVHIHL